MHRNLLLRLPHLPPGWMSFQQFETRQFHLRFPSHKKENPQPLLPVGSVPFALSFAPTLPASPIHISPRDLQNRSPAIPDPLLFVPMFLMLPDASRFPVLQILRSSFPGRFRYPPRDYFSQDHNPLPDSTVPPPGTLFSPPVSNDPTPALLFQKEKRTGQLPPVPLPLAHFPCSADSHSVPQILRLGWMSE